MHLARDLTLAVGRGALLAVEALRELKAENADLREQTETVLAAGEELQRENEVLRSRLASLEVLAERMAALEATLGE